MTIKTVLPKGWIVLQSSDSKDLVTATSKDYSRNLADFDLASLLNRERQKK